MSIWFSQFDQWWMKQNSFAPRNTQTKTIYCITEGPGMPVKIGITYDITNRFMGLRSSTWRQMYLCWTAPGRCSHEAGMKLILRSAEHHCEWFRDEDDFIKNLLPQKATEQQLCDAMARLADIHGVSPEKPEARPRRKSGKIMLWQDRVAS